MRASQQAAYVVDASVVLKYYVPEELSDRAARLLNSLASREVALWAPSVLWLEVASALCKKQRRGELGADRVRQVSREAIRLPIRLVDEVDLVVDALEIALSAYCSVYDAVYIARARRQNLPLLTADDRLVRTLAGTEYEGVAESLRNLES